MARKGDALILKKKTWYLDARIGGKRFQKMLGKNISRSVALELAQVQRGAILRGEAGIGKKRKDLLFKDAVKKFVAWATAEKRVTTVRGYRQCLERLTVTFGDKRLGDITPWTLDVYKQKRIAGVTLTERPDDVSDAQWHRRCQQALHGAPIRVNRELAVMKCLFNKCLSWHVYEGDNPVRAVKFRKEPKTRLRWVEPEEEHSLLLHAAEPLRTLLLVGLYTGLRIQAEALRLKWEHVDLRRGLLTVEAAYAKNGTTRTVPLNSVVKAALATLKQTAMGEYVFAQSDGSPFRSIRTAFRTACRRAKITGVTPHTLRHTFASRLVMAGVDLRSVQTLGGWQTIGMVERYSHLSQGHLAEAVEKLATSAREFPCGIPYCEPATLTVGS